MLETSTNASHLGSVDQYEPVSRIRIGHVLLVSVRNKGVISPHPIKFLFGIKQGLDILVISAQTRS